MFPIIFLLYLLLNLFYSSCHSAVPDTNKYGECPEVSKAVTLPKLPNYPWILPGLPFSSSAMCQQNGNQMYDYYILKGTVRKISNHERSEFLLFYVIYFDYFKLPCYLAIINSRIRIIKSFYLSHHLNYTQCSGIPHAPPSTSILS